MRRFQLTLCFIALYTICFAQSEPVLVKDINTPQIPVLQSAAVFTRANKIYFSDGTSGGTGVAYESPAGAELTALTPSLNTRFFIEKSGGSTKILRYNLLTTEVIHTLNAPGTVAFPTFDRSGKCYYIANGNELWTADATGPARLLKIFSTPVKAFKNFIILTANSIWTLSGDVLRAQREGLASTGELSEFGFFAANDGGFNGTELWTVGGAGAYMLRDIAPSVPSSNPRHFFRNINRAGLFFTADSAGQQHIYNWNGDRLIRRISAPAGAELWTAGRYFRNAPSGFEQYISFVLKQNGITTLNEIADSQTDSYREIARFTEGTITNVTPDGLLFTHILPNGRSDVWLHGYPNEDQARLLISNASTQDMVAVNHGNYFLLPDKTGKLWRLPNEFFLISSNTYQATLINDFGVASNPLVSGQIVGSETIGYINNAFIVTAQPHTLQPEIWLVDLENFLSPKITNTTNANLPAGQYSSAPRQFYNIGNRVIFDATDGRRGREVWSTDGTPDGTRNVGELIPGPVNGVNNSYQEDNLVYYGTSPSLVPGVLRRNIWRTNGTTLDSVARGTAEFNRADQFLNTFFRNTTATNIGSTAYEATFGSWRLCSRGCPEQYIGNIIKRIPGDTNVVLAFSFTGTNGYIGLPISKLQPLGNRIYFSFYKSLSNKGINQEQGGALWVSDGTAAGTKIVKSFIRRPSDPIVADGKLYFGADDGINGTQLWISDGTEAGTRPLSNIPPSDRPDGEIVFEGMAQNGNNLYFLVQEKPYHSSNVRHSELWGFQLQGGLSAVKLTTLPAPVSIPTTGIFFNNKLLMALSQPSTGEELYQIALPDVPVGTAFDTQSDLSITQQIDYGRSPQSLTINVTLTIRNNGPQAATDVVVDGTNYGTNNYRLEDVVLSAGTLVNPSLPPYRPLWKLPALESGQSAQMRYIITVPANLVWRTRLRSTVRSGQTDLLAANNVAETLSELQLPACTGPVQGNLLVEYYADQTTDASPVVIQQPDKPTGSYLTSGTIGLFELGEQYIRRARGYITPSVSGSYTFQIAGDDNVDVYLSTDDQPANRRRVCYLVGYTENSTTFNKYPTQQSAPITLIAGQRYYVEIVNAEKFGADFFNLQWTLPGTTNSLPIPPAQVESFCPGIDPNNLPDLTLENLNLGTTSAVQQEVITYKFDIKNLGKGAATDKFGIWAYFSTDRTLSADDVQDGSIETGNFGPESAALQVTGASTVRDVLPPGQYYLILQVDPTQAISESNENNNILVSAGTITVTAPEPTCEAKGEAPWEYWIANVQMNGWENPSDKFNDFNTLGYSNYIGTGPVGQVMGRTYTLQVTPGLSWIGNLPNTYCRAWIDFNQNQRFDADELVLSGNSQNPFTAQVAIPSTVVMGLTKMRVAVRQGAFPLACGTFEKGEVEDYTFEILSGLAQPAEGRSALPYPAAASDLQLWPNPVTDRLMLGLNLTTDQELRLSIVNTTGQVLWTGRQSAQRGQQVLPIETGQLLSGMYMLQVFDDKGLVGAKAFVVESFNR